MEKLNAKAYSCNVCAIARKEIDRKQDLQVPLFEYLDSF